MRKARAKPACFATEEGSLAGHAAFAIAGKLRVGSGVNDLSPCCAIASLPFRFSDELSRQTWNCRSTFGRRKRWHIWTGQTMSSTMFKVVLGALAAQTSAQEMMLGQPAVQMSAVSSFSGADGIMHTSVHKVITETSNDGSLKRVEMDCQDGDCSKSVSKLFTGSSLFQQLPKMPESCGPREPCCGR
eukprot:Skav203232  [mRNA]  locus=scaffold438:29715:43425:+ [translate_table: standard]